MESNMIQWMKLCVKMGFKPRVYQRSKYPEGVEFSLQPTREIHRKLSAWNPTGYHPICHEYHQLKCRKATPVEAKAFEYAGHWEFDTNSGSNYIVR